MSLEYTLQETEERIVALDEDGLEIVGAYTSNKDSLWVVYIALPVARVVDTEHPVFPSHLVASRCSIARDWVLMIASLYTFSQKRAS